jgi:hypothetical protein
MRDERRANLVYRIESLSDEQSRRRKGVVFRNEGQIREVNPTLAVAPPNKPPVALASIRDADAETAVTEAERH